MRIGITAADLDHAGTKSIGIYNVALGLCRGLVECPRISTVVVRCDESFKQSIGVESEKLEFDMIDQPVGGFSRILWECWGASGWAKKQKLDWVIYPKGFTPLRHGGAKICAYVHDAMHDFYAKNYRESQSLAQKTYFPALFKSTLRRADLIVTNSEFTTSEVARFGRKDRVATVGIGFEEGAAESGGGEPIDFDALVYLSGAPHKLSAKMIEYLARFRTERMPNLRLCGVGNGMRDEIEAAGGSHFSRLSDEDYASLGRRCKVVIYSSEYEGYGMPPLERLGELRGVICSNIEPMASHIDAGLLFDNDDFEPFASVLENALQRETWSGQLKIAIPSWGEVAERVCAAMSE